MSKQPTPIRAQFNPKKKNWQVVNKTPVGEWEALSSVTLDSQPVAESMVDWYINNYPGQYIKSN